jgi:hypothetical protein
LARTSTGFSTDPNTLDSVSQFISQEGQSNLVYLIGKLETTPICLVGYDACGVCGGDGLSCAPKGCDGIRGRFVCIKNILDCFDLWSLDFIFSGKTFDLCGECDGDNACLDCAGVPRGTLTHDGCGVCGGDGLSCVPKGCDGIVGRFVHDKDVVIVCRFWSRFTCT